MYVAIIAALIFVAGLLGGIANYYLEQANGAGLKKSVLLGLTAAATVPLFLKTVSSRLLDECLEGQAGSYFVLFGFCVIAAIFSSKFLQTLGDKLLQEIKDVQQKQADLAETTDALVAQNSDPAPSPPAAANKSGNELEAFEMGEENKTGSAPALSDNQKVLNVLQSSKFAFRTAEGIAKDAGMELGAVQAHLLEMELQGKVKKTKRSRDGVMVWCMK